MMQPASSNNLAVLLFVVLPLLASTASTCPSFEFQNKVSCRNTTSFNACQVGGCPLDEYSPQEVRPNGWYVRAEPCANIPGDFWKFNPAWAGAHITMAAMELYQDPVGKFMQVQQRLRQKQGPAWTPEELVLKKGTCAGLFPWARLYINSSVLHDVGEALASAGFQAKLSGFHISIGYPAGWEIPLAKYENNTEYKSMARELKAAPWQLVLLKMNSVTKMMEKHSAVLLRQNTKISELVTV